MSKLRAIRTKLAGVRLPKINKPNFKLPKLKRPHFKLPDGKTLSEAVLAIIIVLAFIALIALLYYNVRPLKVADIKVPVATDKASYYAGQQISGIFFGEIFYSGNVKILREVFCKDYTRIIKPPIEAANGDFFDTQSIPRKIEGLTVPIGTLPDDIPLGSNCVIQFTNVYEIPTPFGTRHVEYQYYTQNFSIITESRRKQLDNPNDTGNTTTTETQTIYLPSQGGGQGSNQSVDNTPQQPSTTNNTYNTYNQQPPQQQSSEPVQPPRDCGFLGLGCVFD